MDCDNRCNICTTNDKKKQEKLKKEANQTAMLIACVSHQMTDDEIKILIDLKERIYKRIINSKEGEYL